MTIPSDITTFNGATVAELILGKLDPNVDHLIGVLSPKNSNSFESPLLEFKGTWRKPKDDTSPDDYHKWNVVKALVAMYNAYGGCVLVGLAEGHPDKTQLKLLNCDPDGILANPKNEWKDLQSHLFTELFKGEKGQGLFKTGTDESYQIPSASLDLLKRHVAAYLCSSQRYGGDVIALIVSPLEYNREAIYIDHKAKRKNGSEFKETLLYHRDHIIAESPSIPESGKPFNPNAWISYFEERQTILSSAHFKSLLENAPERPVTRSYMEEEIGHKIHAYYEHLSKNFRRLNNIFTPLDAEGELSENSENDIDILRPTAQTSFGFDDDLDEQAASTGDDQVLESDDGFDEDDSDGYEPDDANDKVIVVKDLIDLIGENKRLAVIGEPGAGKSTCLCYYALKGWRENTTNPSLNFYLPLARWQEGGCSVLGLMCSATNCDLNEIQYLVDHNRLHLLLDALNECPDHLRPTAVTNIQAFLHRYPSVKITITSRKDNDTRGFKFPTFTVQPMGREQQLRFLGKYLPDNQNVPALLDKILSQPGGDSIAANPMLLGMVADIVKKGGVLPRGRATLYQTWLSRWYERECKKAQRASNPLPVKSPQEALGLLSRIAFVGRLQGYRDIPIHLVEAELQTNELALAKRICEGPLLSIENDAIHFRHETFQEYLCAEHLVRHKDALDHLAEVDYETWGMPLAYAAELQTVNGTVDLASYPLSVAEKANVWFAVALQTTLDSNSLIEVSVQRTARHKPFCAVVIKHQVNTQNWYRKDDNPLAYLLDSNQVLKGHWRSFELKLITKFSTADCNSQTWHFLIRRCLLLKLDDLLTIPDFPRISAAHRLIPTLICSGVAPRTDFSRLTEFAPEHDALLLKLRKSPTIAGLSFLVRNNFATKDELANEIQVVTDSFLRKPTLKKFKHLFTGDLLAPHQKNLLLDKFSSYIINNSYDDLKTLHYLISLNPGARPQLQDLLSRRISSMLARPSIWNIGEILSYGGMTSSQLKDQIAEVINSVTANPSIETIHRLYRQDWIVKSDLAPAITRLIDKITKEPTIQGIQQLMHKGWCPKKDLKPAIDKLIADAAHTPTLEAIRQFLRLDWITKDTIKPLVLKFINESKPLTFESIQYLLQQQLATPEELEEAFEPTIEEIVKQPVSKAAKKLLKSNLFAAKTKATFIKEAERIHAPDYITALLQQQIATRSELSDALDRCLIHCIADCDPKPRKRWKRCSLLSNDETKTSLIRISKDESVKTTFRRHPDRFLFLGLSRREIQNVFGEQGPSSGKAHLRPGQTPRDKWQDPPNSLPGNHLSIYIDETWPGTQDAAYKDIGVIGGIAVAGDGWKNQILPVIRTHLRDYGRAQAITDRMRATPGVFPFVLPVKLEKSPGAAYFELVQHAILLLLGWLLPHGEHDTLVDIYLEHINQFPDGHSETDFFNVLQQAMKLLGGSKRFSRWKIRQIKWVPKQFEYVPYADLVCQTCVPLQDQQRFAQDVKVRTWPGFLPFTPDLFPLLRDMDTASPSGFADLLIAFARTSRDTPLFKRILRQAVERAQRETPFRDAILERFEDCYEKKDRDITLLNRLTEPFFGAFPIETFTDSPRMRLLRILLEMQRANHNGDPEAVNRLVADYKIQRQRLIAIDRELSAYADLNLIVHDHDLFLFEEGLSTANDWIEDPLFPALSIVNRGRMLSSRGQSYALLKRYEDADREFSAAISLFKSEAELYKKEIDQTRVYQCFNLLDLEPSRAIDAIETILRNSSSAAGKDPAKLLGNPFHEHLFLKLLWTLRHNLKPTIQDYLSHSADWPAVHDCHPYELILFYRTLLIYDFNHNAAHNLAECIGSLFERMDYGGTLGLIHSYIRIVFKHMQIGVATDDEFKDELNIVKGYLPAARPQINLLRRAWEDPSLDVSSVLPFNYK